MWIENKVFLEDLENICSDTNILWNQLDGKTILITGATGLIGSTLVSAITYYGMKKNNPPKILALVRNLEKANNKFRSQIQDYPYLSFVVGDICCLPQINENINFIIHGASQTSSKAFVQQPVETIQTTLLGTKNLLELAKLKNVQSMVYLSSMEVYGSTNSETPIDEEHGTNLNTMQVRTSYPESKRMCESMCCAYASEYGTNVKVARLTQTFGPGVEYNDGRVFAEFARCVIEMKDIVLHTMGETKRSYLYTADAIRAILTILLKGQNGEAYNVANKDTYCSIYDMACTIAEKFTNGNIKVLRLIDPNLNKFGYAPTLKMNLDVSKIEKLRWKPTVDLVLQYENLLKTIKE